MTNPMYISLYRAARAAWVRGARGHVRRRRRRAGGRQPHRRREVFHPAMPCAPFSSIAQTLARTFMST